MATGQQLTAVQLVWLRKVVLAKSLYPVVHFVLMHLPWIRDSRYWMAIFNWYLTLNGNEFEFVIVDWYFISSKRPSGGIKERIFSTFHLLRRIHGWKWTSWKIFGFIQERLKSGIPESFIEESIRPFTIERSVDPWRSSSKLSWKLRSFEVSTTFYCFKDLLSWGFYS